MREEEAKEKWCPMARIDTRQEGSNYNRWSDGAIPIEGLCIGSDCMMWRWDEALDMGNGGDILGGTNYDTEGHCGLAGKE